MPSGNFKLFSCRENVQQLGVILQETSHNPSAWVGKTVNALHTEGEKDPPALHIVPFPLKSAKGFTDVICSREKEWIGSLNRALSLLPLMGDHCTHIWISALCQQWKLNCLNYFWPHLSCPFMQLQMPFSFRSINFRARKGLYRSFGSILSLSRWKQLEPREGY